MVSKETSEQIFQRLKEDPLNNVCFDCSSRNPDWASVSNGIFLCLQCAGIHRGYGVHISFVRSLSMDTWTIKQLKIMTVGGNKALADFFANYNIPADLPSNISKYKTRAAQYYRDKIKIVAEGINYEAPQPIQEVGILPIEEEERKFPEPPRQQAEQSSSGFSWTKTFGSALTMTQNIGKKIADKTKEISQKPIVQEWEAKTKQAFSAAVEKTKEWSEAPSVQNIKEKTTNAIKEISQSSAVQNIKDKTKSALTSIAGKARETYDSIHSRPQDQESSQEYERLPSQENERLPNQ